MGMDWSHPWIVFFGDQWEHKRRRRQQIAGYLARRTNCSEVLYIENPLTLTSFLKWKLKKADPDACARWDRVRQNGTLMRIDDAKVWVLTPIILFPLTGVSAIDAVQHSMVYRSVMKAWESITGQWFFWWPTTIVSHPWWPVSLYRRMGLNIDLYDCTDDFSKVHSLPARIKVMVAANDEELTKDAGTVTCVSRRIAEQKRAVRGNADRCIHVPNGVDYELFSASATRNRAESTWRREWGDGLVLGYVGGMNRRVDMDLLRHIAAVRPDWRIAVAGRTDYIENLKLPNLHAVGELSLEDIPGFLDAVDVCIIPHKVDELTDSMSPQKMYDYLASGKPIVSTPVAGTEDFSGLVTVASDHDEFVMAVESAIASDNDKLRNKRRAAARKNSWQTRGEEFARILAEQRHVLRKAA